MYLARQQQNTPNHVALYAVDETGHLYDPDSVEFRIVDLTTGLQIFPVAGLEDVTVEGKVDTGVWYAYDVALSQGWAPELGATIGKYRIDWTYTGSDGTTVRTYSFEFFVYTEGVEAPFWTYLTPNAVRAEGITTTELSDARLLDLLLRAQELIERETNQPFRPIRTTMNFDGTASPLLPLAVPIVGVEYLKLNRSTQALDPDAYRVYFVDVFGDDPGWAPQDHRRNPKIMLVNFNPSPFAQGGVFGSSISGGRFRPGAQAHELKGVFGFLERDGTTPRLIQDAALRIVLATAATLTTGSTSGSEPAGPLKRERTDRHEVEWFDGGDGFAPTSPLLTSREVEEILARYKRPIGIGSPATNWSTLANP